LVVTNLVDFLFYDKVCLIRTRDAWGRLLVDRFPFAFYQPRASERVGGIRKFDIFQLNF